MRTAFLSGLRALTSFQAAIPLEGLGRLRGDGDSSSLLHISSFVVYVSLSSLEHFSINCKSSMSLKKKKQPHCYP
jgi:hypothetical protein